MVGSVIGKKQTKPMCNSMSIKIVLNNMDCPSVYINLLDVSLKRDSFLFKSVFAEAQECLSVMQLICDKQEATKPNNGNTSDADEIMRFKNLLDGGIITQEEFDAKKRQLLGL